MTEVEWLACNDPRPMLEFLQNNPSDRKMRLFACACCRRVPLTWKKEPQITLLEMVERFADGLTTWENVDAWCNYCADECPVLETALGVETAAQHSGPSPYHPYLAIRCAGLAASWAADPVGSERGSPGFYERMAVELAAQAKVVRCVFGNHRYSVVLDVRSVTATVAALAQAIYAERAFDRLPILADALEDAGCANRDILDHCRQPGPHVRGCWVVDLVLDKE